MLSKFRFLIQYWPLLIILAITSFLASSLEGAGFGCIFFLAQGQGMIAIKAHGHFQAFFDYFNHHSLAFRLGVTVFLLIFLTCLKAFFSIWNTRTSSRLQAITLKHFRFNVFDHLVKLGMGYLNKEKSGFLLSVTLNDLPITGTVVLMVANSVSPLMNVLVLGGMLFFISWRMVLVCLALGAFIALALKALARMSKAKGQLLNEASIKLQNEWMELLRGMKVIHLFDHGQRVKKKIELVVDNQSDCLFEFSVFQGVSRPIFETVVVIALATILVVGSLVIGLSHSALAILMTFIVIFYRIAQQVMLLSNTYVAISGCIPFLQGMNNFLSSADKHHLINGNVQCQHLRESVVFDKVSFAYVEGSPVLKDITLTIKKGQKIGIVGPSGSGKSTLVELLLRFYDPQQGKVLIDGLDLRELSWNNWRKLIGVVSQDIYLFNDTVYNNIAFPNPQATRNEVEFAAQKAHAHEFIKDLPQGYDTLVGERGVLLSGGQRQRLAIARAIMNDPEILIFDEATSALDSESEKIVQEAFSEVGINKTVITIAHRLSTVRNSDYIFVIDKGSIIERGSHDALMRSPGVYAKLVSLQALEGTTNSH